MSRELPTIAGAAYTATSHSLANIGSPTTTHTTIWDPTAVTDDEDLRYAPLGRQDGHRRVQAILNQVTPKQKQENEAMGRRLVQVFIADPDENVPLEQALIYSGEQKFTDATDQELFFEVDINKVLKEHNERRVKLINKKVKDRVEHLEPAKIRDLKMVVVNIASF